MDNTWNDLLDTVDWDAVDKEVNKLRAEEAGRENLLAYFDKDGFDFKRSYIRKIFQTRPEITDRFKIDAASEQMYESHTGGVELDVDDALRFVENDKPVPVPDLVKMLNAAGLTDENVMDVIESALSDEEPEPHGEVKNKRAKSKAITMERCAMQLDRNPDVLVLGLPTFDPLSDWTQVKLAFFGENFTAIEVAALSSLMKTADKHRLTIEHGVAVAVFQIYNIWADFK